MKSLLVEYGKKGGKYLKVLEESCQQRNFPIETNYGVIEAVSNLCTTTYYSVWIIIEESLAEIEELTELIRFIKKEQKATIVLVSNSDNLDSIDGDLFFPLATEAKIIIKNLEKIRMNMAEISSISLDKRMFIDEEGNQSYLTEVESRIVRTLLENRDKVLSREEILVASGYENNLDSPRVVDAHMKKIREKIIPNKIRTVRGVGYCWEE